jgi:hypothetical protein
MSSRTRRHLQSGICRNSHTRDPFPRGGKDIFKTWLAGKLAFYAIHWIAPTDEVALNHEAASKTLPPCAGLADVRESRATIPTNALMAVV